MGYVYKIFFQNCDYFYIGSTNNIKRRKNEHIKLLNLNNHFNPLLQKVFNKYKDLDFKLIYEGKDYIIKEQEEINLYFNVKNNLNLRDNVSNLSNIVKKCWETKKENIFKPFAQINNKTNKIVAVYKNIIGFTEAGLNTGNVGNCLKKEKGTSLGYRWEYLNISLEDFENKYKKYITDKPISKSIRKVYSIQQLDINTNEVLNVYTSLKEVGRLAKFQYMNISKLLKKDLNIYEGYKWETIPKTKTEILNSDKFSKNIPNLSGIIVESLDKSFSKNFKSISEAVSFLGFDDSLRTKFSRVAKGKRKSTRGYTVNYINN